MIYMETGVRGYGELARLRPMSVSMAWCALAGSAYLTLYYVPN